MPLYEYECDAQHHRFEVIQKFSDAPIAACPTCGSPVHKLMSAPAFQLKGTGWYITDYARKDSGAKPESKDAKESSSSTEKSGSAEKADSGGKSDAGGGKSDAGGKSDSATKTESAPAPAAAASDKK
jgi:putative FmdB family regulatory protein